jgi:hypothetical protein
MVDEIKGSSATRRRRRSSDRALVQEGKRALLRLVPRRSETATSTRAAS